MALGHGPDRIAAGAEKADWSAVSEGGAAAQIITSAQCEDSHRRSGARMRNPRPRAGFSGGELSTASNPTRCRSIRQEQDPAWAKFSYSSRSVLGADMCRPKSEMRRRLR
jgi:hypothetical protein